MPQLDLDLMDDHLFLAFGGLLLGLGESRVEEGVIEHEATAQYGRGLIETASTVGSIRSILGALGNPKAMFSNI
jgi:hypothetical protein